MEGAALHTSCSGTFVPENPYAVGNYADGPFSIGWLHARHPIDGHDAFLRRPSCASRRICRPQWTRANAFGICRAHCDLQASGMPGRLRIFPAVLHNCRQISSVTKKGWPPRNLFRGKMIFKGRGTKTPQVFWGKSFYKKSSVSFR